MADAHDDFPPILDAAQVAALLQLNIDYVRKLTREGTLPARRIPGGRALRYFRDDILQWLRDQPTVAPVEDTASADRDPD